MTVNRQAFSRLWLRKQDEERRKAANERSFRLSFSGKKPSKRNTQQLEAVCVFSPPLHLSSSVGLVVWALEAVKLYTQTRTVMMMMMTRGERKESEITRKTSVERRRMMQLEKKWTNRWLRNRKRGWCEGEKGKMGIEWFYLLFTFTFTCPWIYSSCCLRVDAHNTYAQMNKQILSLLFFFFFFTPFHPLSLFSLCFSRGCCYSIAFFWVLFWWCRWRSEEGLQKWSESVNAKRAFGSKVKRIFSLLSHILLTRMWLQGVTSVACMQSDNNNNELLKTRFPSDSIAKQLAPLIVIMTCDGLTRGNWLPASSSWQVTGVKEGKMSFWLSNHLSWSFMARKQRTERRLLNARDDGTGC